MALVPLLWPNWGETNMILEMDIKIVAGLSGLVSIWLMVNIFDCNIYWPYYGRKYILAILWQVFTIIREIFIFYHVLST